MKKVKLIKNIACILIAYILIYLLLSSGVLSRQYRSLIIPIGINIMLAVSLNTRTCFGSCTFGYTGCFNRCSGS